MVADGWIECPRPEDPKQLKRPFLHRLNDGELFAVAGLWTVAQPEDADEPIASCAVVTTSANRDVRFVNHRMRVVDGPAAEQACSAFYSPRGESSPIRGTRVREPGGAQVWPAVIAFPTAPIPASIVASTDSSPGLRGAIVVTGSPSASTRRIRSRRSHFDTRLGSVEMMISSNCPSLTARCTASKGSGPPTSPSTGRPAARCKSGNAVSSVQSAALRSLTSGTSSANWQGPA
jgi:hypothetical protein